MADELFQVVNNLVKEKNLININEDSNLSSSNNPDLNINLGSTGKHKRKASAKSEYDNEESPVINMTGISIANFTLLLIFIYF